MPPLTRCLLRIATLLLALPALAPVTPGAAQPARAGGLAGFVVVVHADNPTPSLPREHLARLFLRKVARWPGGQPAMPVDLPADAPVRAAFTRHVLARTVTAVRAYWQERIFSGRDVPPPERAGEAEALAYVRAHPAAVGYVSATTALPPGVRVLPLTEP
ncbi:hypothetical protein [Roseisolibacter agri]|uniref:PBP domain-containing protein n=1 Tax=Roseisolibacter agri TaxID=2014610 RepID=A0AA37Q3Z7_9BACT|nr:hypothetical protein [Roseisolibacter agri]GLC24202.1 hypothetical protein rosag_07150 [Roseisolibacter agri]